MGGWLGPIAQVAGAGGAGIARGKFNRQQMDREEMLQALAQEALKRKEARENRELDLTDRRLTMQDRERSDVLNFRKEDAKSRAEDRDADREARREAARQASADRGEARSARREARELRPDERDKAAQEFAYRMVAAAAQAKPDASPRDLPRYAQGLGERDMATARKLGVRREHYYGAAQQYADRLTSKSKAVVPDAELEGAPAPKAPASTKPSAATGEAGLSDADLWEKKREEGLSPVQATDYVHKRRK